MQQGAQALSTLPIQGALNVVRNGRARLQALQTLLLNGVDGVAHRLLMATQMLANLDGGLATRIGQENLSPADHKGIGRACIGFQRCALTRR